jgi:hypothetical protein
MDLATQTHLGSLRNLLTYRLGELRAELHARELSGPADAAGDADGSQLDMTQVQAALQRLDAGVYGDCTDCGEPIPLARLWVKPDAPRCARCEAIAESRCVDAR